MSKVLKRQGWLSDETRTRPAAVLIQAPLVCAKDDATKAETALTAEEVAEHFEQVEAAYASRMTEAEDAARRLIEEAMKQAEQIRTEAYEQGRASGYTDGFQSGRAESEAKSNSLVVKAGQVVQNAEAYRRDLVISMADVFTGVTMQAVRQLLDRELSTSPSNVRDMVNNLLTYVLDSTRVEVRVHPDEFAIASEAHPKWQSAKFGSWEVVIVPDVGIAAGGCEIRSEFGRVDSRIETKLAMLEDILREEWERSVKTHADSAHS